LTPLERTSPQTLALAESFATSLGARPIVLDAAQHDRVVAAISHLPFALAVSLMTTTDELAHDDDLLYALVASGFRDTSRLAASDTTMMLDILLTNRENIADDIRICSRQLNALANLVDSADELGLGALLERVAASRRHLTFDA
jgi:prephenate dehydrogenase